MKQFMRAAAAAAGTLALVLGAGPPAQAEDAQTDHRRHRGPDLVVTRIFWEPMDPRVGDDITFGAVIKNRGGRSTPAGAAIDVLFVLDSSSEWAWNVSSGTAPLRPGASRTVTIVSDDPSPRPWEAERGEHLVEVTVDSGGAVRERDERNNTRRTEITLPGAPGTLESSIRYSPPPVPGRDVVAEIVHRLGPSPEATQISSILFGYLVTTCVERTGRVVPGSREVEQGVLHGSPRDGGPPPNMVASSPPITEPATVVAEIRLDMMYRQYQQQPPRRVPCPEGSRPAFVSWDITSLHSYRYRSPGSGGPPDQTAAFFTSKRVSIPLRPLTGWPQP